MLNRRTNFDAGERRFLDADSRLTASTNETCDAMTDEWFMADEKDAAISRE